VNTVLALLKYFLLQRRAVLRALFCLSIFIFSSFSYGAKVEPLPYFLFGDAIYGTSEKSSSQFFSQPNSPNFYREVYGPEEFYLGPKDPHKAKSSLMNQSATWLIDKRNEWSSMIGNTGSQLDLFFAGETVEYKANASYLRLGLEVKFSKQGELSFDPVFKFKLDLPTVKKRLKLVVESHTPEQETLSEANLDNSLQDEDPSISTTTGAFQYVFRSAKNWKKTASVGVKLNHEPNPFWRMRMKRRWNLVHDWNFKTLQSLYYFHDDSWGETTKFIFEKPVHSYFFDSKTEARWWHKERLMEYAQIFSIKKKLSAIRAIKYSLGLLAENQPTVIVTDYYVKATYRRLLYKDWLFYEVSPELLFPREDSFKANPSILMRFEVKFSNL
jgi:hypothetical protein